MRCPHCKYHVNVYYWDDDGEYAPKSSSDRNEYGDFYMSPITLERGDKYENDRKRCMGCPKCNKLFMSKYE